MSRDFRRKLVKKHGKYLKKKYLLAKRRLEEKYPVPPEKPDPEKIRREVEERFNKMSPEVMLLETKKLIENLEKEGRLTEAENLKFYLKKFEESDAAAKQYLEKGKNTAKSLEEDGDIEEAAKLRATVEECEERECIYKTTPLEQENNNYY